MAHVPNRAPKDEYAAASADQRDRMAAAEARHGGQVIDRGRVSRQLRQRITDAMAAGRGALCTHIEAGSTQPAYMELTRPDLWVCAGCVPRLHAGTERPCDGCGTREGASQLAVRSGPVTVLTTACTDCRTD